MLTGDLLKRMADAYAGAKTYTDRGRARSLRISSSSRCLERGSFATFLDRQHGFRLNTFEGSSADRVLWNRMGSARTFQSEIVAKLLARCIFLCKTAINVPSLLLPGEFRKTLLENLRDPQYQGQEDMGRVRCHRIFGRLHERTQVTLWLDEDRYLVRKLVDRTEYPFAREAAKLRDAHLRRREQAFAAGIPRKILDQVFGPEHLLAIKHWPYAQPREDARRITRVAYEPQIGASIDPAVFRNVSLRA